MFNVRKRTQPGQDVFISGSVPQLGIWDVRQALPLSAGKYTEQTPVWYGFEKLPVGLSFEYKYVLKNANEGAVMWEAGENRRYTVPTSCAVPEAIEDDWR